MLLTELNNRKSREDDSQDEYRRIMTAMRKDKDDAESSMEKEGRQWQVERDILVQRQREHDLAMAPPPYQSPIYSQPAVPQAQAPPQWAPQYSPPPGQYGDQQAAQYSQAAVMGGMGGAMLAATMSAAVCTLM